MSLRMLFSNVAFSKFSLSSFSSKKSLIIFSNEAGQNQSESRYYKRDTPEFHNIQKMEQHKIVISNEDTSFLTFVKLLQEAHIISDADHLRCKKAPVKATAGNKFKKIELEYVPFEGSYQVEFQETKLNILIERGDHVLTTQCRQIDYLKSVTISGPTMKLVRDFVEMVFKKLEGEVVDEDMITVYENNGGQWSISKEKRARKIESVIFKQDFINTVLSDIKDFISSESWYLEMGIPYKRSYLLYGPPGTGKSSFAQALAGLIKYSICFVNCSDRINDFYFNYLLNRAPKKSIILIEDVDSIFSERKNVEKNNSLTFSGFLNAIDGVRSQEGRILIMTTNFKERLDPALLRPGRVDEMYEINYSSRFQIQKLCYRFFKNEDLAKKFADQLPENKFSMSMIQGFLLRYRKNPEKILENISGLLESDQNIKIEDFLTQINCLQVLNDFKIEECYSLAHARSLPKQTLEKIITRLSQLHQGRFLQTIRCDRKVYLKSPAAMRSFIEQNYKDEQLQRNLRKYAQQNASVRTFFQIRDKAKQLTEAPEDKKEQKEEIKEEK